MPRGQEAPGDLIEVMPPLSFLEPLHLSLRKGPHSHLCSFFPFLFLPFGVIAPTKHQCFTSKCPYSLLKFLRIARYLEKLQLPVLGNLRPRPGKTARREFQMKSYCFQEIHPSCFSSPPSCLWQQQLRPNCNDELGIF